MKYSKMFLLLSLSVLAMAIQPFAYPDGEQEEGVTMEKVAQVDKSQVTMSNEAVIVYVTERGTKSKIAKYLYKDLIGGLKRSGKESTISFVAVKNANASLFDKNDVVILVSEGKTMNPTIKSFANVNAENPKLLVLAFHPSGTAFDTDGIDAMTSPSPERKSKSFVKGSVTQKVVSMLEK